MNEVNLSIYDRQILEQIQYNLEAVASALEKLVAKEKFYQTNSAIINLAAVHSIGRDPSGRSIWFSFYSNEGQAVCTKEFENTETMEAEYKRLAEVVTK